jgi:hypothetical protein
VSPAELVTLYFQRSRRPEGNAIVEAQVGEVLTKSLEEMDATASCSWTDREGAEHEALLGIKDGDWRLFSAGRTVTQVDEAASEVDTIEVTYLGRLDDVVAKNVWIVYQSPEPSSLAKTYLDRIEFRHRRLPRPLVVTFVDTKPDERDEAAASLLAAARVKH